MIVLLLCCACASPHMTDNEFVLTLTEAQATALTLMVAVGAAPLVGPSEFRMTLKLLLYAIEHDVVTHENIDDVVCMVTAAGDSVIALKLDGSDTPE